MFELRLTSLEEVRVVVGRDVCARFVVTNNSYLGPPRSI